MPIAPQELAKAHEAVATTAGHVIESDIGYYLKGIPGVNISWFPRRGQEPELDFVLTVGLKRVPIEVKYCRCRHAGDSAGIRWFCDQGKYNSPFGLQVTQEVSGPLNEQTSAPAADDPIGQLLDRYDLGEIETVQDLADEAEALATETDNELLMNAVQAFRTFQREDWALAGRGDWDEAEAALIAGMKRARSA